MRRNSINKSLLLAAVVGVPLAARAADPASDIRVTRLEAKIAALEAKQAANSSDLAAAIDAVLRDAEKHSQFLANSGEASAGYDDGFFIRSGDAWVLRPGLLFQFRNVTNFRESAKSGGGSDWENGFEIRRLRPELAGTAISKDLEYYFLWDVDRNSGSVGLLEAWVKYSFSDNWGLHAGQFRDLTTHEWVMGSRRQLAVETSLVDSLIGGTGVGAYVQGVTGIYGNRNPKNPLYIEAGITDGASQSNTDFTDRTDLTSAVPKPHTPDFGLVGRVEYKLAGDWKNYKDFTAKGVKEDLLVVGAGGDWSQSGDGNLIISSADIQWKNASGWSIYGAGLLQYEDANLAGSPGNVTNWGGLAQVAYLISPAFEVFGRYDLTLYDKNVALKQAGVKTGDSEDLFHEITVGVNYYLGQDGSAGHRAKFTLDLSYLPNSAPKANTGLGILDDNNRNGEWVLRAQFQLLL